MRWRCTLAVGLGLIACRDREPPSRPVPKPVDKAASTHERELAALLAFEERTRASTDFAAVPPSDAVLGPDPYRIARLRDGSRIGLLRGEPALVLLDRAAVEQDRIAVPRGPSGLAVTDGGDVLVAAETSRALVQLRVADGRLERIAELEVGALGMRDVALAANGHTAYVVEEREGRLLALALERTPTRSLAVSGVRELGRCHGPIQVEVAAGHVATNCVLDHAIEIRRERGGEVARIHHDGPLWGFTLHAEPDGSLLVAAGGVEDHPLVREDGGFGYIDSFLYVYRLRPGATEPTRLAAINTSELGVVTPKWVAIRSDAAGVRISTAGHGSAGLIELAWPGRDLAGAPKLTRGELPPGTAAADLDDDGVLIAANALLDAWIVRAGGETRVVAAPSARPPRAVPSRIGELLFFTTLMAPWNKADGKLSRFTCETCHHEGYSDGRTHYTGRGKVHATSRPLYGLFNNRPHFSRALDETTTEMVHSEFRVANRFNGRDPWFALTRAELPWLAHVGAPARMSPAYLREAFMRFLADFTHRPNPAALGRDAFSEVERTGAGVFRDRCASCHAPRLIADDPRSQVAFDRWESLVLSPAGPIVWSNAAYAKTGVVPYPHSKGTRAPSLRRLHKKWPYFTNGSAKSLADVLERFAHDDGRSYHDGAPDGATRLTADERRALLAFLELL